MLKILLVEDNKGDQVILREAFKEIGVTCDMQIVEDGTQAMKYLNREAEFKKSSGPDLVILDLNLPKKNGKEVLEEIRGHELFRHTPVLILSNSIAQKDVCECYALKANAYIGKPSSFQGFLDLAQMIKSFWIQSVRYCPHA